MPTITARMPYYLAPTNSRPIISNIRSALKALESSNYDAKTCFSNFKNQIIQELAQSDSDNDFLKQNINDDAGYKSYLESVKALKKLDYKELLNNPNAAVPSINEAEAKFQHFIKQQKLKFDQAFANTSVAQREKLWANYEKELASIYQPVADFSKQVDPAHLLTHAMRFYVQKVMGKKDKTYGQGEEAPDQLAFTPRPQFIGSDNRPLTVEYDQNGKATSVRVHPYTGNVGDALAIFLASLKEGEKIPPIKIVCPLSNADIVKSEMSLGPSLFIILLAHTAIKQAQIWQQKKQVKNAATEKGIPLKHISLEDNRGRPIPISPAEQERLNATQKEWAKNYIDGLGPNKEIEMNPSGNIPRMTPGI